MSYPVKFSTNLSDHLDKLREALSLTDMSWSTENLPEGEYARSSSFVIADFKTLWSSSPIVPQSDCPILVGKRPLASYTAIDTAKYILKSCHYWKNAYEKTRHLTETRARDTHYIASRYAQDVKARKEKRKAARSNTVSKFIPLPGSAVNAIKAQFDYDDRFNEDNRKVLTNVIRNTGCGTISGIHFLFPHFRGRKVAAICTTQDETSIHTLKQWQAAGVNARHLISDLPFPTDKLQSVYDLYHKLAEGLDALTK